MSTELSEDELQERQIVLQTRQDYEEYEAKLKKMRSAIVDQSSDAAAVDEALSSIDRLYARHVQNSHSSVIVHEDQQSFLHISGLVLARARSQVHRTPGAISVDSFVRALRDQADTLNSGPQLLDHMGELFVRAAGTAVLPSSMPEISEAQRRKGRSGPRAPVQSERDAIQPEDGELETVASDDREQQETMQLIVQIVSALEKANNYDPLLLYELCLQQHSFAETMENCYLVSVLISSGKLWLAPNKRGLPVVGTAENRKAYLIAHGREDEAATVDENHGERHQFNFNMDYSFWRKLCGLFPADQEPSIIPRRRDDDAYNLIGRPRDP